MSGEKLSDPFVLLLVYLRLHFLSLSSYPISTIFITEKRVRDHSCNLPYICSSFLLCLVSHLSDQEDLESTNFNHIQGCPFLPHAICGRHRVSTRYKTYSYSDISGSFTTSSCSISSNQSKNSNFAKPSSGQKDGVKKSSSNEEPTTKRKGSKPTMRKTSVTDSSSPKEETQLLRSSRDVSGYESIQVQELSISPGSESLGIWAKEEKRKSIGSLRREFFADFSSEKSSNSSFKMEDSLAKKDASGRVQVVKIPEDEGMELKGMIGPIAEEGEAANQPVAPKSTASSKRTALLRMSGKFKRDKLRDSLKLRPGLSVTNPPEEDSSGGAVKELAESVPKSTVTSRRSRRRRDSSPASGSVLHSTSVSPSTSSHLVAKSPPSSAQSLSRLPSSKRRHSTAPTLHPPPPPRSASRSPSRFGNKETGL